MRTTSPRRWDPPRSQRRTPGCTASAVAYSWRTHASGSPNERIASNSLASCSSSMTSPDLLHSEHHASRRKPIAVHATRGPTGQTPSRQNSTQPQAASTTSQPQQPQSQPQGPQGPYKTCYIVTDLKRAPTWTDVRLLVEHAVDADAIDLGTALHRLQAILGPSAKSLPRDEANELAAFIRSTVDTLLVRNAEQSASQRCRTMSMAIWSLARLHFRPDRELMTSICASAVPTVTTSAPQGTANMLLGLALLEVKPEESGDLVRALVLRARHQVSQFKFQETCQVLWACAKLRADSLSACQDLFKEALHYWPQQIRSSIAKGKNPSAKNFTQLAFAYSKVHRDFKPNTDPVPNDAYLAFLSVLPEIMNSGGSLSAQGIAVVMWAYAKLGGDSQTMCKVAWALYPHVCAKLKRFSSQGLTMMCYSLALSRLRHEPLLDVLTTECRARLRSFNAQDCGVLVWSTGRLAYDDEDLLTALKDRYLDVTLHAAPSIGTVSQILKGCVLHDCIDREFITRLSEQAEAALGVDSGYTTLAGVLESYEALSSVGNRHLHHIHMANLTLISHTKETYFTSFEPGSDPGDAANGTGVQNAALGNNNERLEKAEERLRWLGATRTAPAKWIVRERPDDLYGGDDDLDDLDDADRSTGLLSSWDRLNGGGGDGTGDGDGDGDRGLIGGEDEVVMTPRGVFMKAAQSTKNQVGATPLFREVCNTLRELDVAHTTQPITTDGVLCDVICFVRGCQVALQLLFKAEMVAVVSRDQVCCTPADESEKKQLTVMDYHRAALRLLACQSESCAIHYRDVNGSSRWTMRVLQGGRLKVLQLREEAWTRFSASEQSDWLHTELERCSQGA